MPPHVVARKNSVSSRLPDALQLGAAVLVGLDLHHIPEKVQSWLPLSRGGGHGTRGIFAFAVVFLLAGPAWGIRPFAGRFARELRRLVAPLVSLRALPSATALSRALGDLQHNPVRSCLDQLLFAGAGLRSALTSPHILHRDAHGHGWHVLDLDPTIEGFRQRSLPGGPTLPEPKRRAQGTPGYTGHKRGELRIRHLPVQHAGLGAWLAYRLDAAGTSLLPLVGDVVRVAKSTIINTKADSKIILRADGEFGSVGAMRTITAEGVDLLTRLSRYAILEREDVVAQMPGLAWYNLTSSGAGPQRQAADLGLFMLHPDEDAAASKDGPVEVRVVVTRFARTGKPDHGILKEGYQLELFATTLSPDAWPPEAVASLYFGRAAIENSFSAEDREFGIDRTFSYHPPGQELMSGVALFLWNVMIAKGIATNPLPAAVEAQEKQAIVRPDPPPKIIVQSPPIPVLLEEVTAVEEKPAEPSGSPLLSWTRWRKSRRQPLPPWSLRMSRKSGSEVSYGGSRTWPLAT
jgi:Transposase DDE domain